MSTINIALTSYPKRITNCVKVIQSVLDNTVVPDRIYLTLAHSEFPNWEDDLPKDLYQLIMTSNRVILNWVDENTKSFKKVFPIMPFLDNDDIIIDIDDDMLLPKDFIESRIKDFNDNGKEHPISSNLHLSINLDNLVMSAYSLFQKKMLNGYEKFMVSQVLNTFNDDRTYLYLIHLNGYRLKPCTKYCVSDPAGKVERLKVLTHSNYKYMVGDKYDEAVAPIVSEMSNGRTINDCFGLFCEKKPKEKPAQKRAKQVSQKMELKPQTGLPEITIKNQPQFDCAKLFQYNLKKPKKHDLVYVLGRGSKWGNIEIKISITSMLKFCSQWIGEIYVIGENPNISHPKVHCIYAPDITKSNKDGNIIFKILTAIWKVPTLTDNFLFCSDDILVTKPSDWEDFAPRYIFEYKQTPSFREEMMNETRKNEWDRRLVETLERFVGYREHIYFYEPHIFAPINKYYFREMCKQIDYTNEENVMVMSLWFNWINLKDPPKRFDHKSVFKKDEIPYSLTKCRHLTYNDATLGIKSFRNDMIDLVKMEEFS